MCLPEVPAPAGSALYLPEVPATASSSLCLPEVPVLTGSAFVSAGGSKVPIQLSDFAGGLEGSLQLSSVSAGESEGSPQLSFASPGGS